MPTEAFRAACVQMRSGVDRARTIDAAEALIREAAGAGATFISTPEMTNVLDKESKRLRRTLSDSNEADADRFAALARDLGVWLHLGSLAVLLDDGAVANRAYLIDPAGAIVARYDKIHLFDVDLPTGERWRESAVFRGGTRSVVARTPLAAFGLSICYDLRFPAHYRAMARTGADVLLAPAAFTKPTGEAHWETLLRARAIENGAFVIAAAQGGRHEDGRETYGRSLIVSPWGDVLSKRDDDAPGLIFADIEPAAAARARAAIPNLALDPAYEVSIITS
ncbi:MAG: carbon-nitrogen hydrolase family protein [Pseudomonadota bacterium]